MHSEIGAAAPRLGDVFNIQGGELIFLLLIALVVLGPEKLPDAVRRFTKAYSEFKKMANGFQGEMRSVLEEPMRELRDTADLMREAANIDIGLGNASTATPPASAPTPQRPVSNLNFGNAEARKAAPRDPEAAGAQVSSAASSEAASPSAPTSSGLNFGDPSKRRRSESDADTGSDEAGSE